VKFSLRSHIQPYDNVEQMKLAKGRTSLRQLPFQNGRKAFIFIGKLTALRFSECKTQGIVVFEEDTGPMYLCRNSNFN
jgi:hypothetical protein